MISVRDLHKSFEGKPVLKGVNLEVKKGETLTILGRSGEGKTVLLKNMVGLMKPDKGEVIIDGFNVSKASRRQLYKFRRRLGFVFQGSALFDSLTVFWNVALPLAEAGRKPEEIRELVAEALRLVGLEGTENLYPAELSGGMRKRVGVARAIVAKPQVLFYDEPTAGLDPVTADAIGDLILKLKRELGTTSVVVTHDLHLAAKVSDRLALLKGGVVAWEGNVEELRKVDNLELAAFLKATEVSL